jgi:hypothetical protein
MNQQSPIFWEEPKHGKRKRWIRRVYTSSLSSSVALIAGNAYKEFLVHFLTTEARSGHSVLTGQRYSTASEQCLKYLHKQRRYPCTDDEGDRRLMAWALECLPNLLDQSSETEALVRSAQCMRFTSKVGNLPAAEYMAKAAIERYLSRCTKFLAS